MFVKLAELDVEKSVNYAAGPQIIFLYNVDEMP